MTRLTKPVRREVSINGRRYIVSMVPATDMDRFDYLDFRQHKKRKSVRVPIESALLHAASRQLEWDKRERKRLRKLKKAGEL